ncbi:MAG: glycosyltransferase [Candidatus Thorarchaeota archaeon]|jgi:hypothetical protein
MKVTAVILTCNEREAIKCCVASICSLVDDIVVGIDRKTQDGTRRWLVQHDIRHICFDFSDFSTVRNLVLGQVATPWAFVIDSDETVTCRDINILRQLSDRGEKQGIDAFFFARRHWDTLTMDKEWTFPYPDYHTRLFRSSTRYEGKVHEGPLGINKRVLCGDLIVEHFNRYYKTVQQQKETHRLYVELADEK